MAATAATAATAIAAESATAPADDFIADIVAGRIELPTIPRVVQRLIRNLRRSDVSLHALADELRQDPVLSARVLRLANSSFYSGRRSLASVGDAVAVIGVQSLQTLVIACGVSSAFVEVPGVNLRQFWLDAVVTATAAQWLTQQLRALHVEVDADSAHAAGLLLGTGHLILCQAHPLAAAAEFTRYRDLRGAALAERERAVFGIDHARVGALWVDRLGFPTEVGQAIGASLTEPAAGEPPLHTTLRMAREIAASVGAGDSPAQAAGKLQAGLPHRLLALHAALQDPAFSDRYAQLQALPSLA